MDCEEAEWEEDADSNDLDPFIAEGLSSTDDEGEGNAGAATAQPQGWNTEGKQFREGLKAGSGKAIGVTSCEASHQSSAKSFVNSKGLSCREDDTTLAELGSAWAWSFVVKWSFPFAGLVNTAPGVAAAGVAGASVPGAEVDTNGHGFVFFFEGTRLVSLLRDSSSADLTHFRLLDADSRVGSSWSSLMRAGGRP
ncbi:hypothetical protein K438DRAFT_1768077 [Mycena galopus ATCC 62051]|nr:hypothetical protein K438DRAFT_1768077 [Mycena galopus ATCC 62051]